MAGATAESNVRIVRDGYAAFNDGDIDAVLGAMADDIEWTEPEGTSYSGTYRSPEAVLENVFGPTMEDFEEFRVDADRFIDGGDTVVVLGSFRGKGRKSGERFDIPFAHVYELEDGRMTRLVNYTNTLLWQQALEA